MAHVGDEWKSLALAVENLIVPRSASGAEGPHDIFTIVNIYIIANEDKSVNGIASLVVKYKVANFLG